VATCDVYINITRDYFTSSCYYNIIEGVSRNKFHIDFQTNFQHDQKWFRYPNADVLTVNAGVEELLAETINGWHILWTNIAVVYWMAWRWLPMWDVSVCPCLHLIQQLEPQGGSLRVTTDIWLQKPATGRIQKLCRECNMSGASIPFHLTTSKTARLAKCLI
jgi:hypothetical protein